jgi:DNA replicative helicase MCM subunit Mcm2 (Cdc46/Mcm family)
MSDIHQKLSQCHPSLQRNQVWCRQCGHTQQNNSAESFAKGWPKHCGQTMTIDSPEEQKRLDAVKEQSK